MPERAEVPQPFTHSFMAPLSDPGFVDAKHGDYRLRSTSLGVGQVHGLGFPDLQPAHKASPGTQLRSNGNDVGAFMSER
jgi:hypothetical protein